VFAGRDGTDKLAGAVSNPAMAIRRVRVGLGAAALSLGALAVLSGCAARRPAVQFVEELGRAQALVAEGCHQCLQEALTAYERVAARPRAPETAARGAFETALLLTLRARELGLPEQAALGTARAWAAELPPPGKGANELPASVLLDALTLVDGETSGVLHEDRERRNRDRRAAWPADGSLPPPRMALSPAISTSLVAQYVALAIDCEDARARKAVNHAEVFARFPQPLIRFRVALCGIPELRLDPLRQENPRWVDTLFFEARAEMSRFPAPDVGRAAELYAAAHEAFPASTAITLALGHARNALEDHAAALALFDAVLESVPTHRDAMLGRLLSLSYLRRHYDAVRTATQMIDLGTYHMGDAYYWRAWNRYQVHELPPAWDDVERASTLMVNTAVFTLAGFVAYAQRELDTAIDRLSRAYRMDNTNCEAVWTEGMVHVDKEQWEPAAARFTSAVGCFAADARQAREAIATAEGSTWADAVKTRRIGTAQKRVETSEHRRAQSAFNAASSYLRLSRKAEALGHVDIAATHPLLKDKAAALRATIEKLQR
jgi:tetratricopeptide (TPR) repeat protein